MAVSTPILDDAWAKRFQAAHPAFRMLQVNTGTKGICAPSVIEALVDNTRAVEEGGYAGYAAMQGRATAARDRLAATLGAKPSELAFTGNASASLNVALSLPWESWGEPVDVLISDHEYPTTNMVFGYLQQIGKIRLVRYAHRTDAEGLVEALERSVTPGTRVAVLSHVDCNEGRRADAAAFASWARSRDIVSFVDGAQAVGQFPVDLGRIGCDLYITNGHKWLYGPNGVGLLYVRDGFETCLVPTMVGSGTMHFQPDAVYVGEPGWTEGAHRFELTATRPAQVLATMDTALDWLEGLGPGAVEARQRALAEHLKRRILEQPDRYTLRTPIAWEESSALVSIGIVGCDGERIAHWCGRALSEGEGFLRPVPEFDALRISTAYYNTEEDYERLFGLLERYRRETVS
ncbi:MAG: aminotransferase class V-fold PLP-dependent enzyme [Armatimonadota bacterium]